MQHSCSERTSLQPGYLPLREAAKWAGISPRTMKRWIKRGLPTYQAGPREKVLVRQEDINQFLTKKQRSQVMLEHLVEELTNGMDK